MATEKEQKPQESREADAGKEGKFERKQPGPDESRQGLPGYGQPPEEVREKHLPDQKW